MEKNWQKISLDNIKFLRNYYITLFLIGIILTCLSLLHDASIAWFNTTAISIIGGFGTSLMGCTIFYLRKIYKSCINLEVHEPDDDSDKKREFGVFSYYFLRPLFSIGFSLFIHIALKAGVSSIAISEIKLGEGFIYLTLFLSFFGGFAAGDFLTKIESKSEDMLSTVFKQGL